MRSIALMAANFLRQRFWPILLLFLYIMLTAALAGNFGHGRPVEQDIVFHTQQQSIYICIFSAFLAADAMHTERKSRRILLVLAKAVSRAEYLLAVIAGTTALSVCYGVLSAWCTIWLARRASLPGVEVWSLLPAVVAGAMIAASVAVFLSTFLNPYFATGSTLFIFCAPIPFHIQHQAWSVWLPGFPLLVRYLRFSFHPQWSPGRMALVAAVLESVLFWIVASAIFERRDVAVPVE
jgi:ABC-type transport system involved in multi-copper enzyme maturation permease subunit